MEELDGCRMHPGFWLGDINGMTTAEERRALPLESMARGLCKHAAEEMAMSGKVLPHMYRIYGGARSEGVHKFGAKM
jgi:hypothetical protein